VVREIVGADDASLVPAHALLRRAFSRAEMLPLSDWKNALRERAEGLWLDQAWHLLVAERNGRVVAAATGAYLGNVNVGIVGYIAVTPVARASGLGPRLRNALRRKFDGDARGLGHAGAWAIVGEVRDDNPWLGVLVRRERAIALDFPYYQPSLGDDRDAVPLVLYYQPLRRAQRSLSSAYLRRLLYTMWRRVYRVDRPLARPEFRRMLRALRDRRRVGQSPVVRAALSARPRRPRSSR
jgi:hypothetical protein